MFRPNNASASNYTVSSLQIFGYRVDGDDLDKINARAFTLILCSPISFRTFGIQKN
jgi:hypothetical protein